MSSEKSNDVCSLEDNIFLQKRNELNQLNKHGHKRIKYLAKYRLSLARRYGELNIIRTHVLLLNFQQFIDLPVNNEYVNKILLKTISRTKEYLPLIRHHTAVVSKVYGNNLKIDIIIDDNSFIIGIDSEIKISKNNLLAKIQMLTTQIEKILLYFKRFD